MRTKTTVCNKDLKALVRAGRVGTTTIREAESGLYVMVETKSEDGLLVGVVCISTARDRYRPRIFKSMRTARNLLQQCGITRYDVVLMDYEAVSR